ncbi:hypothetical protein RFI_11645, partial [Reticulomyxa filosa]
VCCLSIAIEIEGRGRQMNKNKNSIFMLSFFLKKKKRPGRGIFVRKHVIKTAIDEDDVPKYSVGDRVKLSRGRHGHIKYIEDTDEGEIYGIEVDVWTGESINAEVGRTRRFSVKHGHSITRSRFSIAANLLPEFDQDNNAARTSLKMDRIEENDDKPLELGETVELTNGMVATIRFIGITPFSTDEQIGVELHDGWGKHDGAYKGVRYFTCPPKRGLFVKEVKRRRNDDPSRQYLKRRCPECEGEFLKLRNPPGAYKGAGMVCDHCYRHGSKFTKEDWFFQCSKCEQVDLCLDCMLKLHSVDDNREEDIPDLRARYRQVNGQWIFEEIDIDDAISELSQKDQDADHDMKTKANTNEKTNSNFNSQLKDVFDFFDQDEDGILKHADIEEMWSVSKRQFDRELFIPPVTFEQFQEIWDEFSSDATKALLSHVEDHKDSQ